MVDSPISGTFFFSLHRAFKRKYFEKVSKKFLVISLCDGNKSSKIGSTESYERRFVGFPSCELTILKKDTFHLEYDAFRFHCFSVLFSKTFRIPT